MATDTFIFEDFLRYKNVSRETFLRLETFVELLKKWQKTINLVSQMTIPEIWTRHIIDSSQLLDYMRPEDEVADIGSGGGFPGLVLSILGIEHMTLIESDTRKVAFLREAARITEANIHLINKRVEDISLSGFSKITARGFAPLQDMFDMLKITLRSDCNLLLLKGKNYKKELQDAQENWSFDYEAFPSLSEKAGAILSISNLTPRKVLP